VPRPLLALLTVAVLAAAGCGTEDSPTTSAEDDEPIAACEGDVEGVTVSGGPGAPPTVDFDTPLSVERTQCTVLTEGTGDSAEEGDTLLLDFTFVNGRTGSVYGTTYDVPGPSGVLVNDQLLRGVRIGLLGIKSGARVVTVISPEDGFGLDDGDREAGLEPDDSLVFVADVVAVNPRAEGTAIAPVAGLPTVELAADGSPTIHLPGGEPPAELVAQTLIEGTGPVLQEGQEITAHYTGILWASGQEFDSTWGQTPTSLPLRSPGVIAGWVRGLVGKTVGSQVLLIIPAADGYGAEGSPEAGIGPTDTLVFVVDILYAA
jgi:peptidylprolyl isomerase